MGVPTSLGEFAVALAARQSDIGQRADATLASRYLLTFWSGA